MRAKLRLFLGTGMVVAIGILAVGVRGVFGIKKPPNPSMFQKTAPGLVEPPTPSARVLLAQAEKTFVQGNLLEAKRLYRQILLELPDVQTAVMAQERLGDVNLKLLFSPAVTPDSVTHVVESGDTLFKIARKFHTTVELLMLSNRLTGDQIRLGQRLKVVQAKFSLIVDKSQNILTLKNGEEVLKVYRCSTGEGGITPAGTFRIKNRLIDPPWFTPQGVIPPNDPRNILGSRWLGFDLASYGIHGTTDPTSIGKSVTQGCVRLANAEVEELFALLPVETPVTIIE